MRVSVDGTPGLVQGTEVSLELDTQRTRFKGTFLMGCVLERFLGLTEAGFFELFAESPIRCIIKNVVSVASGKVRATTSAPRRFLKNR